MKKGFIVPFFGDIHGNIEGLYNTLSYLQKENGTKFGYAFQVGDMGFFKKVPKTEKIRNDLELGLFRYLNDTDYGENFFYSGVDTRIIFIRGNHEDQEYLKYSTEFRSEGTINVDEFGKFLYMPDGRRLSIGNVSFSCLGGISKESRPKKYQKNPLIAYSDEGIDRLLEQAEGLDVLLTHQGPKESIKGEQTIDTLIELIKPKIHIHGHSHVFSEGKRKGKTISYGLGNMPHLKRPFLECDDYYGFLDLCDLKFHKDFPVNV